MALAQPLSGVPFADPNDPKNQITVDGPFGTAWIGNHLGGILLPPSAPDPPRTPEYYEQLEQTDSLTIGFFTSGSGTLLGTHQPKPFWKGNVMLGADVGVTGELVLRAANGEAPHLRVQNDLIIGNFGQGTIRDEFGSFVEAFDIEIGKHEGSTGRLDLTSLRVGKFTTGYGTLAGAADWLSGSIYVGFAGHGVLRAKDLRASSVELGYRSSGSGEWILRSGDKARVGYISSNFGEWDFGVNGGELEVSSLIDLFDRSGQNVVSIDGGGRVDAGEVRLSAFELRVSGADSVFSVGTGNDIFEALYYMDFITDGGVVANLGGDLDYLAENPPDFGYEEKFVVEGSRIHVSGQRSKIRFGGPTVLRDSSVLVDNGRSLELGDQFLTNGNLTMSNARMQENVDGRRERQRSQVSVGNALAIEGGSTVEIGRLSANTLTTSESVINVDTLTGSEMIITQGSRVQVADEIAADIFNTDLDSRNSGYYGGYKSILVDGTSQLDVNEFNHHSGWVKLDQSSQLRVTKEFLLGPSRADFEYFLEVFELLGLPLPVGEPSPIVQIDGESHLILEGGLVADYASQINVFDGVLEILDRSAFRARSAMEVRKGGQVLILDHLILGESYSIELLEEVPNARILIQQGSLQAEDITIEHFGGLHVEQNGVVFVTSNIITNLGKISGNGIIHSNIETSGFVTPGSSPGTLTINGDYTQTTDGTLEVEIAGDTAGTLYDVLEVTGTATLAGTLEIVLLDGYVPTPGTTFKFLQAGTVVSAFDSIVLPDRPGWQWDTSALATGGSITFVALPEPGTIACGLIVSVYMLSRRRSAA